MRRKARELPHWMTEGKIVYRPPWLLWTMIAIGALLVAAVLWGG